jgi:hypothetical protein
MSDGNAGRADTPQEGFFQRMRKSILIAAIALPVLTTILVAVYILISPAGDDVAQTVREAGFDPLVPPNRLRGPGALYQVDGSSYRKVCNVDPAMLEGKVQQSPTPEHVRRRLEKGGFAVGSKLLEDVNGRLGGTRVTSIEYKLTNVSISEIAMSDLFAIQAALLSDPGCLGTVKQLLRANKQVCAGYAALSATTSYRVRSNSKVATNAEAKPAIEEVKQAIQLQAHSDIVVQNDDELTGENLFYGIQVSQLCITLDGETAPSVAPPAPKAPKQAELIDRFAVQ